jgi:putative transposase
LEHILSVSCELYNAALQERRDAWKICREHISLYDQQKELTQLRALDPETASVPVDIAREPLRRVDHAFRAFFRRCKAKQFPGFPRFRAKARYDSFATSMFSIDGETLRLAKTGLRFRSHREIKGTARHCAVIRVGRKWTARITCEVGPAPSKQSVSNAIGIDLGLENFICCSDGSTVENPRWTAAYADKIARKHRALATKRRGSKNRERAKAALGRAYAKVRNCRSNFTHHVSKQLVSEYDLIAHENLNVAGMARSTFAKSILDAAWGQLLFQIAYKAEQAGRYAIAVNPRGTSQRCSNCGTVKKKELSERRHECACGANLHRDHNAALNVLALGQRVVDTLAEAR